MPPKAAFYDVDGTLVKTNIVHVYAYYAMNRGSLLGMAGRTLGTAASLPLFGALDLVNRKVFNEFFYRYYSGFSEDRLFTLVAVGAYTAIVWTMYTSMVKNFDMTIRKQSGR